MSSLVNYEGVEAAGSLDGHKLSPSPLDMGDDRRDAHIARLEQEIVRILTRVVPKLSMHAHLGGKLPRVSDPDQFAKDVMNLASPSQGALPQAVRAGE
ncbi:MAG: hypothetical protein AAF526_02040 [Pseudomonadota bacterium]